MSRTRPGRMRSGVGVAALVAATVIGTAGPAQALTPGSAVVDKLGYNVSTWSKEWSCTYAGWAYGAVVDYSCDFRHIFYGGVLASKDGTFKYGSLNLPTYSYRTGNDTYCVDAWAKYAYSTGDDKETKCG